MPRARAHGPAERAVRKITYLYTDLRAFSEFYTGLKPMQLAGFLDTYYGDAAKIIADEHGTVDGFVGDSIFASFNAKIAVTQAEQRAVSAALRLKAKVAERWPDLPMSVGIATGKAVVGYFGPSSQRFYTSFGDVCSRAILLERRSHFTGFKILVDEPTRARLGSRFPIEPHSSRGNAALEGTKVFEIGLDAAPVNGSTKRPAKSARRK
jgi:adenylate cyclase